MDAFGEQLGTACGPRFSSSTSVINGLAHAPLFTPKVLADESPVFWRRIMRYFRRGRF